MKIIYILILVLIYPAVFVRALETSPSSNPSDPFAPVVVLPPSEQTQQEINKTSTVHLRAGDWWNDGPPTQGGGGGGAVGIPIGEGTLSLVFIAAFYALIRHRIMPKILKYKKSFIK